MVEWIQKHWNDVLAVIGGAYVLALAIVKLTPTKKDDEALERVSVLVRALAFAFGLRIVQESKPKDEPPLRRVGHARVEVVLLLAFLLALSASGCVSPGDRYQASAVAFVVAVDTAAEYRRAGKLTEDEVAAIDAAVDEGAAALHAWAVALKLGEDYPDGRAIVASVVARIRQHFSRGE